MRITALCCATLLAGNFLLSPAAAQDTLWTRTFGGDGYDYAESIEETFDGGYIIGGYGSSSAVGSWDVNLIKTDWRGDTLWTRSYGDVGTDVATCVIQTADGGYAVAMPEGIGNLLRVDANGDSLWVRDYGMRAHAVLEAADGGFLVAGQCDEQCCLLKTDAGGAVDWEQSYPGGEYSLAVAVIAASDGGYALGGLAYDAIGNWEYHLVRVENDGTQLWNRTYGRAYEPDEAWALCESGDGGFVMTGLFFGTLKVDAAGDSVWNRYYGAGEIGCAFSIDPTADGGFVLGGYVDPLGGDEAEYYVVRTDTRGNSLWGRNYGKDHGGEHSFDRGHTVRQSAGGDFVMVGWSSGSENADMDIWLLKIADGPAAIPQPGTPAAPATDASATALAVPSPIVGPGPVRLSYRIASPGRVRLEVFGPLGRRVFATDRSHSAPGCYDLTWSPRGCTAGVYFARLRCGAAEVRQKLIVLRNAAR